MPNMPNMPNSCPLPFQTRLSNKRLSLPVRLGLGLLWAISAHAAWSQGLVCTNDGQPTPSALWERFMDSDCSACWTAAKAPQPPGTAVVDWVIPSVKGDEATLAAVALSEAAERWQALGLAGSAAGQEATHLSQRHAKHALRVVQGVPVNGYLGATLSYRPPSHRPYTAWVLLVEQLPAGTEGSLVPRQLVRAALEMRPASQGGRVQGLSETRAFLLPPGAQPESLRVLAWVQDGQSRLLALAQTHCQSMIACLKQKLPGAFVIAGNVATPEAVIDLENWGADATKVGIGPGKVCITKLKTGFGTGGWQLSALKWCARVATKPIIADGGIREHGDIAKSIRFGATMVMIGSLLAGHEESPGQTVEVDGKLYKEYYGSASDFNKGEYKHVEGKRILEPIKGKLAETLVEMEQDVQSSISYAGGVKLMDVRKVNYVILGGDNAGEHLLM
jgi:IMP dehydrogenase/GMP reductase